MNKASPGQVDYLLWHLTPKIGRSTVEAEKRRLGIATRKTEDLSRWDAHRLIQALKGE